MKCKSLKIVLAILLAAVVALGVYGSVYGIKEAIRQNKKAEKYNKMTTEQATITDKEKVYKTDEYKITLTEDFDNEETDVEVNEFVSDAVSLIVNVEYFRGDSGIKGLNEREYIETKLEISGNPASLIKETDSGLTYVEYLFGGSEHNYYCVFAIKGQDAYYLMNFMFRSSDKGRVTPYIIKWAESFEPLK